MTKQKYIILSFIGPILLLIYSNLQASSSSSANDPFSQNKFLPGIALIIEGSLVHRPIDDKLVDSLEIPGCGPSKLDVNQNNGFNFNYGELVLFAAIDPYFDLMTVFHLAGDSFEIEEAYATTRRLPLGFKAKLGKFKSGFGRINEQHAHAWPFSYAPLIYRSFFGDEGLQEIGMQLNWMAPTNFYLNFGIESLQGENEASLGTAGFVLFDALSQKEFKVKTAPRPNTFTFFGKTSLDIGKIALLAGASYLLGKSRLNALDATKDPYAFAGNTRIFGLNITVKYIIDSYRYLSFQSEYLNRKMQGTRYEPLEQENFSAAFPFEKNQSGIYAQIVYRFHNLWRMGTRWDWLNTNQEKANGFTRQLPGNLHCFSFMIEYNPTEFSRIRVQYDIDRSAYLDGVRKNYGSLSVQLNLAIGAHAAHPF